MTIIAAIDRRKDRDPVVQTGYDLAEAFDDPLVVLHVISESEYNDRARDAQDRPGGGGYTREQGRESAATTAQGIVNESLETFDRDRVTAVGRIGSPADTILEAADEFDARYLVVGGRDRTPVGRTLFGSVSRTVRLHSDRPVVVMTD